VLRFFKGERVKGVRRRRIGDLAAGWALGRDKGKNSSRRLVKIMMGWTRKRKNLGGLLHASQTQKMEGGGGVRGRRLSKHNEGRAVKQSVKKNLESRIPRGEKSNQIQKKTDCLKGEGKKNSDFSLAPWRGGIVIKTML